MPELIQNFISGMLSGQELFIAIATLILSLLICFFGYRLMKIWIAISGFGFGGLSTAFVVNYFWSNDWLTWGCALIAGLICGFLAFRLYEFGVFLFCGLLAAFVAIAYVDYFDILFRWWVYVLIFLAAAVVGSLAVMFIKPISILTTAINGGFLASTAALKIFQTDQSSNIFFIAGIILSILGIIVQFSNKKRAKAS